MKIQNQKGLALIEVLVGISISTIMIFGVYGMYDYSLKMVMEKSRKKEATAIANQEMEYLRNIDYEVLGTGATPPVKTVERNGISYTVLTDIQNVDDPFDNTGELDETGPDDYKTVRVEIQFDSAFSNNNSVILISNFTTKKVCTYDYCVFNNSNFDGCVFASEKCD